MSAAHEAACRASRQRLLNAFLREAGIHDVRQGRLRVPLPASGRALIVDVRHRSALGHHEYGDDVLLERSDGGRAAVLDQDAFVAALLRELTCACNGNGDGRAGRAELAARIADSTARTARYLREGGWSAPPGEATAVTREAEQSLLAGHPFHPTPKSAEGFDDADLARYAPELGASFRLHWLAVEERLVCERRVAAGAWVPPDVAADAPPGFALLPAHPWQARYLLAQPAFAELVAAGAILPLGPRGPQAYATSSVRTVCAPGFETAWKLALHVRITNFVRTNPIEQVRRATDASFLVAALSPGWPDDGFNVLVETGWRGLDPAVAGDALAANVAVLFRQQPFGETRPAPRVLAGLLEAGPDGEPPQIVRCARLAGDVSRWLRRYLEISLRPLLARFAHDGLSFEAHVQNSLLCMDDGGWPTSFWVRDMEGMSASRQRLAANGTDAALSADSPVLYDDDEAWLRLRYYAVTNQLGHLIAVLGRHSGTSEERLWRVAREALGAWPEPEAARLLAAPHLPAKANLLGCVAGRAQRPSYVDIPNPLHRG
jgi:siderophore synthetase component